MGIKKGPQRNSTAAERGKLDVISKKGEEIMELRLRGGKISAAAAEAERKGGRKENKKLLRTNFIARPYFSTERERERESKSEVGQGPVRPATAALCVRP